MEIKNLLETLNFSSVVWQLITPIVFMFADIITGYVQAIINNNVDSQKMRIGLLHKSLLLIIIILSLVVEFAFNLNFISGFVCVYIVLMELISISENLEKAGVDLGELTKFLKDKEK